MRAIDFEEAGYTGLVSVVPPDAPLAPRTHLKPQSRGKVPGVRYPSGGWGGYPWLTTAMPAAEIDAMGANVGLLAAQFPAIDVDVRDPELSALIGSVIESCFPAPTAYRVGWAPKRLYPFRLAPGAEPPTRDQLWITRGEERSLVEVLGAGQQYVVAGGHPSGSQYRFERFLPAAELPEVSTSQLAAVLDQIQDTLDMLGIDCSRHRGAQSPRHVDQDDLRGSAEAVEQAVRLLPNTAASHPHRDDYLRVGYAIRAALPDDEERAFAIWLEWALRWEAGTNTEESCRADWDRMQGPYRIGASWLFDAARQYGYNDAADEFDVLPAPATTEPGEPQSEVTHSELWLAERLVAEYGDHLRYCAEQSRWYAYDTQRWNSSPVAINRYAARLLNDVANRLARTGVEGPERARNLKKAAGLASARTAGAVITLARADRRVQASPGDFNPDPDLLGVPGGVVDLRTGRVTGAHPSMLITCATAVAPVSGPTPKWTRFVEEMTGGDSLLAGYLQRLAGYAFTGRTDEQIFAYFWGEGRNGKGTFLNALFNVAGSYAKAAQMETFMASDRERHPQDLAALCGARLVTAQETRVGRAWDEVRIKQATGGDPITARNLYEREFTFQPAFTLWFSGNTRPRLPVADLAMMRRIHLIPCAHQPKVINPRLAEELKAEYPQILAWVLAGAREWYETGLCPPDLVLDASREYVEEEDLLGRWISECCERTGEAAAQDLWASWVVWCDQAGHSAGTQTAFGRRLADKRFERRRGNDRNYWLGLSLKGAAE